jgi:hypothetical protein
MSRLKGAALFGVLLVSFGCTYGSILEAQCLARCYTLTHVSREESYRETCLNSTNCLSCVLPCSADYKTLSLCKSKCLFAENTTLCHNTCEFLKYSHNQKRGLCPQPEEITGFGKACAETCSNDSQCNGMDKCCYNGCGHTCLQPIIDRSEIPPKTRSPISVDENEDGQSVTLRWQLRRRHLASQGVILYVVQGRNSSGHHPSGRNMDDWTDLAITEEKEYSTELSLGRYYRIKVASVNINGSLGFSNPTLPFRLSRMPKAPSAPINLREGQSTVSNGKINIRVMWDPPKTSDLPITRYRVFHSERRSTVSHFYFPIEEHSQNVNGDQHDVVLEGLHPGMRYFVQVQAISQWGEARKRSDRTSFLIQTIDLHPLGGEYPVLNATCSVLNVSFAKQA